MRPLHGGTISDFTGAHTLITTMIDRALAARPRIAPRIIACVPGCATDIECKAIEEAIRAAGPRTTIFVPQAVAAAIGAGLDVTTTKGRMVVRYDDHEEVCEAGDAFYMSPGHAPAADAGTEILMFSPTPEFEELQAAIMKAMQS